MFEKHYTELTIHQALWAIAVANNEDIDVDGGLVWMDSKLYSPDLSSLMEFHDITTFVDDGYTVAHTEEYCTVVDGVDQYAFVLSVCRLLAFAYADHNGMVNITTELY